MCKTNSRGRHFVLPNVIKSRFLRSTPSKIVGRGDGFDNEPSSSSCRLFGDLGLEGVEDMLFTDYLMKSYFSAIGTCVIKHTR
mmetsp:Transcript_8876/g.11900  ORF Transcript_8876/g.11900 Transcript_8876/m.11900 type:complete len:83 (+) Transcript_8876:2152-2400(+)